MSDALSARRLIENEVFFRQKNRQVKEQFENTKKLAMADGQHAFIDDEDWKLQFYCECSDENCRLRIPLKRSQYDEIHRANDKFVIKRGHETSQIERLVEKTEDYCVVQKIVEPPQSVSGLYSTPVNNV